MSDDDQRLAITTKMWESEDHRAGLVTVVAENGSSITSWPALAAEAIRAINHLTSASAPIPAPVLYEILGELQFVGSRLPQACHQLAGGLQRSLEQHAVYDAEGRDPRESGTVARAHLEQAAAAATAVGEALEAAQAAIAGQGLVDEDGIERASAEQRRDPAGRVWELLRGPFLTGGDAMVVQATVGWEQGGQVRRDLHIPLAEWESWEKI